MSTAMETAEMSVLYNNEGTGAHQQHYASSKKMMINDSGDTHLDSGYASVSSISYSNQTATNPLQTTALHSPSLKTPNSTTSQRKSFDLETIAENYELKSVDASANAQLSIIETPTTRSIRQLNAFHIQTPQNVKHMLETTPTKQSNYFYNPPSSAAGSRSSRKKNSRQNSNSSIQWSPYKRSPCKRQSSSSDDRSAMGLKMLAEKKVGRHSLFFDDVGSPENDAENVENSFDASVHDQSIGFSPIKPHNRSVTMATQEIANKRTLQRHHSGIESSTPKMTTFKRTHNTQTVAKIVDVHYGDAIKRGRMLRKTQSFSPLKRSATVLREIPTNFQTLLEKHDEHADEETQDAGHTANPARKMLAFSSNQFEMLINARSNIESGGLMPPKANNISGGVSTFQATVTSDDAKCDSINIAPRSKRMALLKSRSRLLNECVQKSSPKKTEAAPNVVATVHRSIGEMDIVMPPSLETGTDTSLTNMEISPAEDVLLHARKPVIATTSPASKYANSTIKSDIDLLLHMPILVESPMRDENVKLNVQEKANRTPIKKLSRSMSYNPTTMTAATRSESEINSIMYAHLPCTPPKNRKRKLPKRASNVISDSSHLIEPAAKRKLYDICSRRAFYIGFESFDILSHLMRFNQVSVVTQILTQLSDKDLQTAYSVSRSWSNLIDSDYAAKSRRLKYVKTSQSVKENSYSRNKMRLRSIKFTEPADKRKPFRHCNARNSVDIVVQLSPPVSPSKRKFHENQQVVRKLKPGQKLMRCPRCDGNSVIYSPTDAETASITSPSKSKKQSKSARNKLYESFTIPSVCKPSLVATKNWKSFGDALAPPPTSEYAVCARRSCGFRFCTNCRCSQHIDSVCPLRPLGSSPTSDDDNVPSRITHDIRNSRRNLRRLLNG